MSARRKLGGTPDIAEGLLMEAIGLIVNQNCHRAETPPTLIAKDESFPCKAEKCFIPNTI
jgi:hypothetical protein